MTRLGVGRPAPQDGFGLATPTRTRPRRLSCASHPAGSARGFCGISATGVRLRNAHRMRGPDTPTSTLSIGLQRADLASKKYLSITLTYHMVARKLTVFDGASGRWPACLPHVWQVLSSHCNGVGRVIASTSAGSKRSPELMLPVELRPATSQSERVEGGQ